jgi:hypothetical protein
VPTIKRQLAIGALVLAAVVVVAGVVGLTIGYYRYYKPLIRPMGFVGAVGRLDESVANTSAFSAPESRELSEQQWRRYCDIKAAIVEAVGSSSLSVVEAQRAVLLGRISHDPPSVEYREALRAIGEIGPAFLRGKAAQVKALNEATFSGDEYLWVEHQVFAAAGLELPRLDLDGMRAAPQNREHRVAVTSTPVDAGGAAANRRLVSGRRSDLDAWSALAFFGL